MGERDIRSNERRSSRILGHNLHLGRTLGVYTANFYLMSSCTSAFLLLIGYLFF